MTTSIREQLAILFNRRNEVIHTTEEVQFSAHFRQLAEEYSISLEELKALLGRGMRPGKALRRMLETALKATAKKLYASYSPHAKEREAAIKGYLDGMTGNLDANVQKLVDAMKSPSAAEEVQFARMDFEIEWVYRHGPESCMVDSDAARIAGICYSSNPNIAVAWVAGIESNKPAARCVVNLATRKYGRLYGDRSQVLEWGLKELGYSKSLQESPLLGERLFIPTKIRKEVSEWPVFIRVEGYPFPFPDPRLARWGFTEPGTWHGSLMMHETRRTITLHSPYIDFADYLVETQDWEWKMFGAKKYYGCWMEVVKWVDKNWEMVDEKGLSILPKPDWTGKVWNFRSHGQPMELLDWEEELYHIQPVTLPKEWQWEDITA